MNIFNLRFGFATNSSSTHSLIQIPSTAQLSDKGVSGCEFGWEDFICASPSAKRKYLAVQLKSHYNHQEDDDSINSDNFKFLIEGLTDDEFENAVYGYVDHQSLISLPRNFNGHGLDIKFFKEFTKFIMSPDKVILGGNDNSEGHPLLDVYQKVERPFFLDTPYSEIVARWDEESKYWTLFSRTDGTKVRFSFYHDQEPPKQSEVPDLVDIKITNKCFFACPFCYQGSVPDGDISDATFLHYLPETLAEHRVFEVALGGGEPTTYPNFYRILSNFRDRGVIPNFTTKSLSWFKDMSFVSILPKIGSFALSVQTTNQIKQLRTTLDYYEDIISQIRPNRLKVNVHIVMGLHHDWEFRSLIEECIECNFTPVLLGFKTNGRGASIKPRPYDNWLADIQKVFDKLGRSRMIGLDTPMASQFEEQLKTAEIPSFLYHTEEGKFSCYVDAVTKQLAESSFTQKPSLPFGYDELENFKELYNQLR